MAAELAVIARAAHVTVLGRGFFAERPLEAVRLSFPSPPPLSQHDSDGGNHDATEEEGWQRELVTVESAGVHRQCARKQ